MTCDDFIDYIEERIYPFTFRENGRATLSKLFRKYSEDFLIDCVDIGIEQYFRYDNDGNLTQESVQNFMNKLGGIAYNKSQSPVDQEIRHIKQRCKKMYAYWDNVKGDNILAKYVSALRKAEYTEEEILLDLQNEVKQLGTMQKYSDKSGRM